LTKNARINTEKKWEKQNEIEIQAEHYGNQYYGSRGNGHFHSAFEPGFRKHP
jgi:hypothetical protein